ncbi:preprotein translocase subunit YajC [uncultured Jatrophihabitans sp.]|uniref:preprotein translocase subunit YajC n=1 Tax=uncultured Jatrophihabitans sp. TaxID=1610747 RepID=UPI0035C9473B
MKYLPFLIFAVLIVGMLALSARNRRRAAVAEGERAERIGVGTEVMTTSGLHATVVSTNDDGTVMLSIAPGVEVRWELAALRDVTELPGRYVHETDVQDADVHDTDIRNTDIRNTDIRNTGARETEDKRSGADPAV